MPINRGENRTAQRIVALATLLLATLAASATARAEEDIGGRLELSVGGAWTDSLSPAAGTAKVSPGVFLLGGRFGPRLGPLLAGLHIDCGCDFGHLEVFMGGQLGWAKRDTATEIDVYLEGGSHRVSNAGGDFFGTTTGPTVSVPYAGIRLSIGPRLKTSGVAAGATFFARADLGHAQGTWTTGAFIEGPSTVATYDVGGYTAGVALRVMFGS
jgi:hypothetical protein